MYVAPAPALTPKNPVSVQVGVTWCVGLCCLHHSNQLLAGPEDCQTSSSDQCTCTGSTCPHELPVHIYLWYASAVLTVLETVCIPYLILTGPLPASCPLPVALCLLPFASCPLPPALCLLPFAM